MALSPYYDVFDPFTALQTIADPFFSLGPVLGPLAHTGGRRSRAMTDYPMVGDWVR